ncbi:LysR family transcriptional regulator [Microbacterium protaetiae]|uniref:LysR family transcriptional regulator n=1 Tax=Microbacterium protaetiae TaxID=2509458 RepID=A0A4P6EKX3_9MICO|nr:LysR family transcriptional regulator [Microbacterium protaetiae]QAY61949.1 LysR family transcriptional regulator [Microbacterium protaetiae]
MTFLAVARLGRYTAAAEVLGLNHSTVSRRIAMLDASMGGRTLVRTAGGWEITDLGRRAMAAAESIEASLRALGEQAGGDPVQGMVRVAAPEAFTSAFLVPAVARLHRAHPGLAVELLAATQRVRQNRSGVDLEIVVGRPQVHRAYATPVCDYSLRLYATADYLARAGEPRTVDELAQHPLIYYVESSLQVDDLDRAVQRLPASPPSIRSTSVFAHVEATAAGAGIGVLPDFLAEHDQRLVAVLPDDYAHPLSYWAVVRDGPRSTAVAATLNALDEHVRSVGVG